MHVNANVITIDIGEGKTDGVADVIADLHLYYIEGVEVPTDEEIAAENS